MNYGNWQDIQGYEGYYQVSDKGYVRTLERDYIDRSGAKRKIKDRVLSTPKTKGYVKVTLHKEGISKTFRVHRLVAEAFKPNPDNKPCVNHINGKKWDNRVENLEWSTVAENNKHCIDNGLLNLKGSKSHFSKLSDKDVLNICKLIDNKVPNKNIAHYYKVTSETIRNIQTGKTWNHLTNRKGK